MKFEKKREKREKKKAIKVEKRRWKKETDFFFGLWDQGFVSSRQT